MKQTLYQGKANLARKNDKFRQRLLAGALTCFATAIILGAIWATL